MLSMDYSNFLYKFIEKNSLKSSAYWPRFLSLKTLRILFQETKIRQLTLSTASYIEFLKKFGYLQTKQVLSRKNRRKNHLKYLGKEGVMVANPVPIFINCDQYQLMNGGTKKIGRKELHPQKQTDIQYLSNHGLKQQEIAHILHLSQSTVSKYLKEEKLS